MNHPARLRLRKLIRLPETQLPLAEAALCIAWEDQNSAWPADVLLELDALAAAARLLLEDLTHPVRIISALNKYLFDECGFHGNTEHYNDPANSFLDRVIATRTGLPITLTLMYLEVGWRLGLPFAGLALPGHFLVRADMAGTTMFIDPFNHGRLWSQSECEAQIALFYAHPSPQLIAQVMTPASRRAILARILRNLKNLYIEREAFSAALAASERILLIEPFVAPEVRDRGLLRARLGKLHGALADLDRYARMVPQASDLAQVRQQAYAIALRAMQGN